MIGFVSGPIISKYADGLVVAGSSRGHEIVLALCTIGTTLTFCVQALPELGLMNKSRTFEFFMGLRILYSTFLSPVYSIVDAIAIRYLKFHGIDKAHFGNERMFGAVSWGLVSFVLGICIDLYGTASMYVSIGVMNVMLLCSIYAFTDSNTTDAVIPSSENAGEIELPSKQSAGNIVAAPDNEDETDGLIDSSASSDSKPAVDNSTEVPVTFSSTHVALLLCSSAISGLFILLNTVLSGVTSIVENLVFIFFKDTLGTSNFICGVSVVVTVIFEIPLFTYSKHLLDAVGHHYLTVIACMSYIVRVVGYTVVPSGAWVLAVEPLHGMTYACNKIAMVNYIASVAPPGHEATALSLVAALGSIGKLLGTLLGGYVEELYGSNVLYRGAAGVLGCVLIPFCFLVGCHLRT